MDIMEMLIMSYYAQEKLRYCKMLLNVLMVFTLFLLDGRIINKLLNYAYSNI